MAVAEPGRVRFPPVPAAIRWVVPLIIFSAFLTGVKLIPGLRNNFGPFELAVPALTLLVLAFGLLESEALFHPLCRLLGAMALLAAFSQIYIDRANVRYGLTSTLILLLLFVTAVTFLSVIRRLHLSPAYLLRLVSFSVLIVGPWVIAEGLASGGDIQMAGPFRNRAHMANYMLSAFWMILMFSLWPRIRGVQRWIAYSALAMALYAVAVSGRRSAYLALFVGLFLIGATLIAGSPRRRLQVVRAGAVAALVLFVLYSWAPAVLPQAQFFRERVGLIGERLRQAAGSDEEVAEEDNFFLLQRQGVMMAFRDSPLLGIGWGGFPKSRFSPTGHEVHSTPLRFLAELGVLGLALYIGMMGYLLIRSIQLFLYMRPGKYGPVYLALAVALWSLSISWIYNRHITERTFAILLVVFLAMEHFATYRPFDTAPATRRRKRSDQQSSPRPHRDSAARNRLDLHRPAAGVGRRQTTGGARRPPGGS